MLVTGIWLAAMFTGQSWWLPFLLVGYIVVVPLVALLFGDEEDRREWWDDWSGEAAETETESTAGDVGVDGHAGGGRPSSVGNRDALETLRDRYAAGELTDEQFERKLERLLATETLEDADAWARERRPGSESTGSANPKPDRQRGGDREREPEYER